MGYSKPPVDQPPIEPKRRWNGRECWHEYLFWIVCFIEKWFVLIRKEILRNRDCLVEIKDKPDGSGGCSCEEIQAMIDAQSAVFANRFDSIDTRLTAIDGKLECLPEIKALLEALENYDETTILALVQEIRDCVCVEPAECAECRLYELPHLYDGGDEYVGFVMNGNQYMFTSSGTVTGISNAEMTPLINQMIADLPAGATIRNLSIGDYVNGGGSDTTFEICRTADAPGVGFGLILDEGADEPRIDTVSGALRPC